MGAGGCWLNVLYVYDQEKFIKQLLSARYSAKHCGYFDKQQQQQQNQPPT